MKPSAYLLLAILCLSACSTRPSLEPGPHLTLVASDELPAPEGMVAGSETRAFRIGPFDKLSVSVFGIPELSQTVQVDAAGRIALPLVGSIQAAGLTPAEASEQVEERLRGRYVRDPQVAVNVDETSSQVITIDGQVNEPGVYPVLGRMTLVRAIASAKGTGEFARVQDVVVFRKVGERQMAALYNLDAIRRGSYRDPEVYPNDVVVVGDSPSRRRFRDFLQASPILVAPLIAILQ
ncbi:MAG TPA: polysaccharide biosynthesis/export family protein [Sphingomonas sp.]|uniref:polysaccharide biosynthesis/export family protein n=1 Tax=Sphingomonas sp. TaxID=28214 RepID=UPI002ED8E7E8